MGSVLLVERVAVVRVRDGSPRRLRRRERVEATEPWPLSDRAWSRAWTGPHLAATDVLHLEKQPRPIVHEAAPSLLTSVKEHFGHVTARHAFSP